MIESQYLGNYLRQIISDPDYIMPHRISSEKRFGRQQRERYARAVAKAIPWNGLSTRPFAFAFGFFYDV